MQTLSRPKLCRRNLTRDRGVHSNCRSRIAAAFLAVVSLPASAAILHVSTVSPSPAPPYAEWATAANTIQDAVDAAQVGDTILVNDGLYAIGGRSVDGGNSGNRVAIDRAISVQSVNGPGVTVIDGVNSVRCAYVGNSAVLSGFTLTKGFAFAAGGVQSEASGAVTNCHIAGNSAFRGGGGALGGTLYNCTLTGNRSRTGGGAHSATLYNCTLTSNSSALDGGGATGSSLYFCTLTDNSAEDGGGVSSSSTLYNCTLANNRCGRNGGGAEFSTLHNCTLTGNIGGPGGGTFVCSLYNCTLTGNSSGGGSGGGAYGGTLYNCVLTGNSSGANGGGAYGGGTLYNCLLTGNSAAVGGGGSSDCTLYNCTVSGNTSGLVPGGGVLRSILNNCIVYFNTAPDGPNYDPASTFSYSCTTPLPLSGVGNIGDEPGFVDPAGLDYHLLLGSPCINAGNNQDWMIGATDLDGNPRISWGTVDMGAYEFLVPALGPWTSHGKYVSAVARVGVEFVARGLITEAQKDAFVSAAANSDVGKPK